MQVQRLAVCGWDEAVPALLGALEATGAFRATRVVDHSSAALVRARQVTGLPCAIHPAAALRTEEIDAVLLATPGHAAAAVDAVHRRPATLIVAPELLDPESLRLIAAAAAEDALPLVALRPAFRGSGLAGVATAARHETIEALSLDVTGNHPRTLLQAAVVATLRMLPGVPSHVFASAWGSPCARGGIAVTLRYEDGRLATLDVRRSDTPSFRVVADGIDGPIAIRRPSAVGDPLQAEADRAARIRTRDVDAAGLLAAEAAVLGAIETALETAEVVAPRVEPARQLHLIAATPEARAAAPARSTARGNLRLVVS
ncbi:MAG: hypothetical protein AMXMBFR23_26330 [Chloroflexota bacterium]